MAKQRTVNSKQPIQTDAYMVSMIRTLLANMCSDRDRVFELAEPIEVNDLPEDMPFERDVLRLLLHYSNVGIIPNRGNILNGFHTIIGRTDDQIETDVDRLLEMQTEDGLVYEMSHFIYQSAFTKRVHQVSQSAHELVMKPTADLDERLDEAVQMLVSVSRDDDASEQRDMPQMWDMYDEIMEQRKLARLGGLQYPSLKYDGFVGKFDKQGNLVEEGQIPVLEWGQTALFSSLPGVGKTSIGGDLAEHNAWFLGHDVLYMHLETEQWDMMDRMIARNLLIPTDYLATAIDYRNPDDKVANYIKDFRKWTMIEDKYKDAPRTSGEIIYKYCPGWNVHKINAFIKVMRRRSHARGRGLLVFVDYYNLIDYRDFGNNRAEALGQVAIHLRNNIKREQLKASKDGSGSIYLVIFAQENTDESGNAYTYGSKEIIQYIQVYLSIQRKTAEADAHLMNGGERARNYLGHPRFWHRKGDLDSEIELKILKGNRTGRGTVKIRMENEYFRPTSL